MAFNKIVVATDFSEHAEVAVQQALNIARHTGAELVVAHGYQLATEELNAAERSFGRPELFHDMLGRAMRQANDELVRIREKFAGRGVDVSEIIVDTPIHEGVCSLASGLGADLVVVGSHGRTGLKQFLLGSVAERIVRSSQMSVLVCRNGAGAGNFRRILVPTDFSPVTDKAIETAKAVAAQGAAIELLHCWNLPAHGVHGEAYLPMPGLAEQLQRQSELDTDALRTRHRSTELDITTRTVQSAPAVGIRAYLEENETDLVVMGSRGRRGFTRFLLGSVAETTVRHAPCSVLVVHPDPVTSCKGATHEHQTNSRSD